MGMRLRHQDPAVLGTPAAPAAQPTRGSSIARILRTAWWPRVLVAGLVLMIVGLTLLTDPAQALGDSRGSSGLRLRRSARMARKVLGPGPQARAPGAAWQRGAGVPLTGSWSLNSV